MKPSGTGLGGRSLNALAWGGGGAILRLLLQLGTQIFLARLLGPEQYGVFAIGATVISFSAFFSDIGLAYGLIQKPDVSAIDIRFVFTWQIVLGGLVAVAVYLGAPWIAAFFGEPRATPVVQSLSVLCLLNALAAPAMNLLKRHLDFKSIQLAQLASYVVGYVAVGVPLAIFGAEVWALVAAWLVQATLSTGLVYRASRHPVRPLFWHAGARAQAVYGGTVLATNLVNWLVGNIDRVIVGRAFGSREIGLYATSYNLLYNPTATLLGVVQPVFFSASSRMAEAPARILAAYRAMVAALSLLVLPIFVAFAVLADTVIAALYGTKWSGAAQLGRPLALVMPLFLLFGLTTPLLWTSGRAAKEFQLQLPMAVLWLLACSAAAVHSVQAVAWVVLALQALRCGVVVTIAGRAIGLGLAQFGRDVRGGLVASLMLATCLAAVDAALVGWPVWPRLATEVLIGVLVWAATVRVTPQAITPELFVLLDRMSQKLPGALARWVYLLAGKRPPR